MIDNRYPEVDMNSIGNGTEEAQANSPVVNTDVPPATDGEQIAQQPEAPVQPGFNPDEWLLNFKGQPIKPKDRQHLVNLAQQGYGYSQAMEKLNKEKEAIAQSKTQYDKYAQLDQRFQSDPAFRQKIEQLFNGGEQPEQTQQAGQSPALPPEIMDKLNKAEQFQQTILQERADQKLQSEIETMKKDHPEDRKSNV